MRLAQLDRGFRLVRALQSHGRMSADQLAEELGVSVRTVYRDVEELHSRGITIRGTPGPDGGYELDPDGPIDLAEVSSEAQFRRTLGTLDQPTDARGPLDELEAAACADLGLSGRVLVGTARSRVFFDPSDWYWRDEPAELIVEARRTVLANRVAELVWRDGRTPVLARPYGLVWKASSWYLVGAELTGTIRRWKLDGLSEVRSTDMWFEPPADFDLRAWWEQALEDYGKGDVKVSFVAAGESARELRRRLRLKHESEVVELESGTRFTLYLDNWKWLVPLVGSFMGAVVVTEPPELVEQVSKMFSRAATAQRHGKPLADDVIADASVRIAATRGRDPHDT